MITATCYVRVSTEKQEESGISMEAQESAVRRFCEHKGWEVGEMILDPAVSAKSIKTRPEASRAIQTACNSKGPLVVYALSRLVRNIVEAVNVEAELRKARASLASVTQPVDTSTASGWLGFICNCMVDEYELRIVGERTRFALNHKKSKGERVGRYPPWGYSFDSGNMLIPDTTERGFIQMVKEASSVGMKLSKIAKMLQGEVAINPRTGRCYVEKAI